MPTKEVIFDPADQRNDPFANYKKLRELASQLQPGDKIVGKIKEVKLSEKEFQKQTSEWNAQKSIYDNLSREYRLALQKYESSPKPEKLRPNLQLAENAAEAAIRKVNKAQREGKPEAEIKELRETAEGLQYDSAALRAELDALVANEEALRENFMSATDAMNAADPGKAPERRQPILVMQGKSSLMALGSNKDQRLASGMIHAVVPQCFDRDSSDSNIVTDDLEQIKQLNKIRTDGLKDRGAERKPLAASDVITAAKVSVLLEKDLIPRNGVFKIPATIEDNLDALVAQADNLEFLVNNGIVDQQDVCNKTSDVIKLCEQKDFIQQNLDQVKAMDVDTLAAALGTQAGRDALTSPKPSIPTLKVKDSLGLSATPQPSMQRRLDDLQKELQEKTELADELDDELLKDNNLGDPSLTAEEKDAAIEKLMELRLETGRLKGRIDNLQKEMTAAASKVSVSSM